MRPGDPEWRERRLDQILQFATNARTPTGFGWLLDDGRVDAARSEELWINARMTYVWSVGHSLGHPDARDLAAHGIGALTEQFFDPTFGGWFDDANTPGPKGCYAHDFVLLAGATAFSHSIDGADRLLDHAMTIHTDHFWDDSAGLCIDEWNRDWTQPADYRGANANMHAVEAYLATAEATHDDVWIERASSIAERLIGETAAAHAWRVVEHFDSDWTPLPDLNQDKPRDPFKPFGATPGHALEWARLLIELEHFTGADWLVGAAEALWSRAVADSVGDTPLLPYTTDWTGRPVVTERFHWVMAEAVSAAETLAARTGDDQYRTRADRWWAEIDTYVIADDGSWHHELDATTLEPAHRTWIGRPDAYHAVNALTLPDSLPAHARKDSE